MIIIIHYKLRLIFMVYFVAEELDDNRLLNKGVAQPVQRTYTERGSQTWKINGDSITCSSFLQVSSGYK